MVAVRDIRLCHEDRGQLLPAQDLLQVFQHARVRQRQRDASSRPQNVVGPPRDDREFRNSAATVSARLSPKRMLR